MPPETTHETLLTQPYRVALRPRALVLSSQRPLAAAIARYLTRHGFTSSYTVSHERAQKQLGQGEADLLVIDLPEETEVVSWDWRELADDGATPVLVLWPASSPANPPQSRGLRRLASVRKPVAWDSALRLIGGLLAAPRREPMAPQPPPPAEPRPPSSPLAAPLSPREQEVLRLLVDGQRNKQIALRIGLSEPTVKKHVQRIVAKLRAADRTHAAAIAVRAGLIE